MTDGPPEGAVVRTSYTSTPELIAREALFLRDRQLGLPGYWRGFVWRRLALLAVVAVMGVALVVGEVVTLAGMARGTLFILATIGLLTALDVAMIRRRVHRAHLTLQRIATPPGTVVGAVYRPDEVEFVLPSQRTVYALGSVESAVRRDGFLCLELADAGGVVVVPDELLGERALRVLRRSLGARLREPLD